MIRVQTIRPTLIRALPTTRAANRGVEVRHLQGHAGTRSMIRGHLNGATAPAIEAAIVGRLLGVKAIPGLGTLSVITAAPGPVDASVNERGAHRRLGHVRQRAGAVRPRGGISGEVEGIGGMILGDGETFWIV